MENEEVKEVDSVSVDEETPAVEETENVLQDANDVSSKNVLEETESNEEVLTEKKTSAFSGLLEDIAERLRYVRSLFYTGIVLVISLFGCVFFSIIKSGFTDNVSMRNSCTMLQIFFGIVAAIFVVLFVSSIVLNVLRKKSDKSKKK